MISTLKLINTIKFELQKYIELLLSIFLICLLFY